MDEEIFRALADPSRRALLDALRERDGQALSELEAALPGMTRFGVMKHLRVLADASLITTIRDGRRKLHYLNAVPIRLIYDRWVSKYTEPWAAALTGLKHELEKPMEKVYEIYIKTTPERLWQAITDPELRSKYSFGVGVYSDWKSGTPYHARTTDMTISPGLEIANGDNIEVDPPHRLVQTFRALWNDDVKLEGESRVTWEIEPVGDSCRLRVTHDQLRAGANGQLYGGWPMILSGLKTWLEAGAMLTTPGAIEYLKPEARI